jgi:CubicO group peptidase (beta-lactamase class C family)
MGFIHRTGLCVAWALASGTLSCSSDADMVAAPEPEPQLDAARAPIAEIDFRLWDEMLEAYLETYDLAGASAAIVHAEHGLVHVAGYGEFESDRIYLVASLSKPLAAGVIMRLHDQGVLDIDAPLGEYLGGGTDAKAEITLAQLMSHSSGLPGLFEALEHDPYFEPYMCTVEPDGVLEDCARAIYLATDAEERVPPDTTYRYGGSPWQLAGGVAEAASSKPWAELLRETYVEPCGVESLGFTNHHMRVFEESGGDRGAAFRYPDFVQGSADELPRTENPHIEGGGYISAAHYAEILLMHLRGGLCGDTRALSAEAVARMQEDRVWQAYAGESQWAGWGYGLGWFVSREEPGLVAHNGAYGAVTWLDGERKYAAVVIFESDFLAARREVMKPVLDAIFDDAG